MKGGVIWYGACVCLQQCVCERGRVGEGEIASFSIMVMLLERLQAVNTFASERWSERQREVQREREIRKRDGGRWRRKQER